MPTFVIGVIVFDAILIALAFRLTPKSLSTYHRFMISVNVVTVVNLIVAVAYLIFKSM